MKMTLEEARSCLRGGYGHCKGCKFDQQSEFDCRGTAVIIGASAIDYLLVGHKMAQEAEEKER